MQNTSQVLIPMSSSLALSCCCWRRPLAAYALMVDERLTSTGSGVALVGGPFTMVNHKGETVTDKDLSR